MTPRETLEYVAGNILNRNELRRKFRNTSFGTQAIHVARDGTLWRIMLPGGEPVYVGEVPEGGLTVAGQFQTLEPYRQRKKCQKQPSQ